MLHLRVADAFEVYSQLHTVLAEHTFGSARVRSPELQDYGALVTFLWVPSGVLWHLAEDR